MKCWPNGPHKPHNTFLLAHTYTWTLTQQHNLIENWMRNRMRDKWLNNCLVIYIGRDTFCWYWKWKNHWIFREYGVSQRTIMTYIYAFKNEIYIYIYIYIYVYLILQIYIYMWCPHFSKFLDPSLTLQGIFF